ncbi:hypothetical protein [uncultured Erythrobacter sp.]|uniref:hypothetical protein n=1 Tax=uncultured Erythrobacter sp. TaxID=263913 RepID=UPI00261C418B|nr:hypothetical protein [uncultured Erythrobacter sp.]
MQVINQEYFQRPQALKKARGEKVVEISDVATARAEANSGIKAQLLFKLASNGGIANPKPDVLSAGTTIIRFSRGPFIDKLAGGEWWLDMAGNKLVESYADRHGYSIQEALSRLCAVPPEWNDMTLKVQFKTLAPLSVYRGFGKDAFYEERKTGHVKRGKVDSLDGRKVEQLYIPGLNHPDLRRRALIDRGSVHMPAFKR